MAAGITVAQATRNPVRDQSKIVCARRVFLAVSGHPDNRPGHSSPRRLRGIPGAAIVWSEGDNHIHFEENYR